jgi:ferredoxin
MQAELQALIAFHLTGRISGGAFDALAQSDLQPAILAGYRDLTALRYDFPIVLIRGGGDGKPMQSLSGLFDSALNAIADDDAERVRKHAYRIEREIRTLVAEGAAGSLSKIWDLAAAAIGAKCDDRLQDSLRRLRAAVKVDGDVIGYDKAMPFRLFRHAWQTLQDRKTQNFRADINKLIMKLSDILSADFVRSKEGLSAERLRATVGAAHRDTFDFDAMSRLLGETSANVPIPESRRRRVRGLLSVLRAQRFFAPADSDKGVDVGEPYSFVFENCTDAVAAYRERLPRMIELAKAIAMARLETEGEYSEGRHDTFFAEFGDNGLDPADLALFPGYLICLRTADLRTAESELILQAFVAGMPAKVIVQTDDIVEPSPIEGEYLISGLRNKQLTSTAMGFGAYYVLQASGSSLFQLREQILRGLACDGPALFSVFSGASGSGIAPYLTAAAAAESRTFPAFIYDPSAGPDWASRFSLSANSQIDLDWPLQRLDYEDAEQQLVSETLAFTPVDFAACDPRCAKHFAKVPRGKWSADLLPVAEFLARQPQDLADKVPCLLMVDRDNHLQKVIVDDKLVQAARRCVEAWRSLQELGGVHNSHAARLLDQERKIWAEQSRPAAIAEVTPAAASSAAALAPAVPAPESAQPAAAERPSDDPYIETPRCTSCNECTQINDKMFAYDANKQAYIVNPDAGTYRQLVEAAESCQVSIIHPGKPRNPDEPGLDELKARAEPFL